MIAGAADGLDDIGVADGLELAAEGADTGGNDVAFWREGVSKDGVENNITCGDIAWMLNEVFQEQALVVGESRLIAICMDGVPSDVEHYLGCCASGLGAFPMVDAERTTACVLFANISQLRQGLVKPAKRIASALLNQYVVFCHLHCRAASCRSPQRLPCNQSSGRSFTTGRWPRRFRVCGNRTTAPICLSIFALILFLSEV